MQRLSRSTINLSELSDRGIDFNRNDKNNLPRSKILQIGNGNFLRGFLGWMVDIANEMGCIQAEITIVKPLESGSLKKLTDQDCLYTVVSRGLDNNREVVSKRLIRSVNHAINPYEKWQDFLQISTDRALKFVVSNTTEAGIYYDDEAFVPKQCPKTFPAKMAALLYERYKHYDGSADSGLIFLPCELIAENGHTLKNCILKYAQKWSLPSAFMTWVENENIFCNTLVDRIVPGFPRAEAQKLFQELGYVDEQMVASELYHLWIIEASSLVAKLLPLHEAGLNVVWTDNLASFRQQKVRILNGAHSACALAGFSLGLTEVRELTTHQSMAKLLNKIMFEEIVPLVSGHAHENLNFAKNVIERFSNPYINHQLLSISLNSISKWRVRVLPSIKDYFDKHQTFPKGLTFSLSALIYFYEPSVKFILENDQTIIDKMPAEHSSIAHQVTDSSEIISLWFEIYKQNENMDVRVNKILSSEKLWSEDLTQYAGLEKFVFDSLSEINLLGMQAAIDHILVNTK